MLEWFDMAGIWHTYNNKFRAGTGGGRICFSKILTFKPWGRDTRPYIDQKSLGRPKGDMNGLIWPKLTHL